MATEKRLIDVCAEIRKIDECLAERKEQAGSLTYRIFELVKTALEKAPTVDAVEVKHGWWEDVFKGNCAWERYKCSVCGGYALYRNEQVYDEWKTVQALTNYCSYCGAYMENGEENGEM